MAVNSLIRLNKKFVIEKKKNKHMRNQCSISASAKFILK